MDRQELYKMETLIMNFEDDFKKRFSLGDELMNVYFGAQMSVAVLCDHIDFYVVKIPTKRILDFIGNKEEEKLHDGLD